MLSIELLQQSLPANLKKAANQSLLDTINNASSDPEMAQMIRDNFVSYTSVLKDGKFKTEDYLSAVMYVSYKLMGDSNKDAWAKTFPQRYANLVARGAPGSEISAHVTAYNRGKLPNLILEQSLVPSWVLNQDLHQKAINQLAHLMMNANSEKVQSDSANALLTHLKKPEGKIEVDLNIKDSSGMNELRDTIGQLAKQQQELIQQGAPIRQITDSRIIDVESERVS